LNTKVTSQLPDARKKLDLVGRKYAAEMETGMGPIRLQFFPAAARGHVENFLALSQIGFYDNLTFHRVIDGFMIQGGCPRGDGTGDGGYKIPPEFNSIPHVAGVLSMARSADPNSASTQFFICLATHKHLDKNYTAFGKVIDEESMATIKAIGSVAVDGRDRPNKPVVIKKVTLAAIESIWLTWREGTVPGLAKTIRDSGAFDLLPILGDALEEAGCTNANLLSQLRRPGPHDGGCWVVDFLVAIG
jgi:peptidyl-prolyl cis-trans isomerase B (cyclophilin B)